MAPLADAPRRKAARKLAMAERALADLTAWARGADAPATLPRPAAG